MNWISHVAGLDNASGAWYLFWSGVGANLRDVIIVLLALRLHRCHVRGCWRWAHHHTSVNGVEYKVCRKHHPNHHGSKRLRIDTDKGVKGLVER